MPDRPKRQLSRKQLEGLAKNNPALRARLERERAAGGDREQPGGDPAAPGETGTRTIRTGPDPERKPKRRRRPAQERDGERDRDRDRQADPDPEPRDRDQGGGFWRGLFDL